MYCTPQTLSDIKAECGTNIGGVKSVAVRNRADVTAITITDGVVSALTLSSATGTPVDAAVIGFRPQTCLLSSEATIDQVAGTHFYTNTLSFRFAKMNAAKRTSIVALSHAQTIALVKDNNDTVWLVGYEEPLSASALTGTTGTAHSDANEYTPSLSCMSPDLLYPVSTAAVSSFLGDAEF